MARLYYVDTSAYLCVLLGEDGSAALVRELGPGYLFSSSLLVLEATRNLVRLSRGGVLSASSLRRCLDRLDEDVARFELRDLTLDLCRGLLLPVVTTPRTLDLVHLRTALWFHQRQPIDRFVTLDEAQQIAASELGLPV